MFNRKYNDLVNVALAAEWGDARKFFREFDMPLRVKMSAAMRFVANRSLFNEPDDLWTRLSDSYTKRNKIIHEGENATEDQARQAIAVARAIVQIMNGIVVPPPPEPGAAAVPPPPIPVA